MKTVNLLATLAIAFSLTSMVSCTSDLTLRSDAALTATAVDEGQASSVSDQVISSADDYLNELDAAGYQAVGSVDNSKAQKTNIVIIIDSAVIITIDRPGLNEFPKKICIDFGTTGVTVKRGNVLKGKVYILQTGKMTIANSSRTFKFANFYVNDNLVEGYKVVTYKGLNTDSKQYWTISASDTITRADGKQIVWNSERVRTLIGDNGTPKIYWDDTFAITGSANGINAKGVAYTMTVQDSNPLIIGGAFPYFTKGTVIITTENKTVVVDYGDGTKDTKATATINGVTKEFNLRK